MTLLLKRGSTIRLENPTLVQIEEMLQNVKSDNGPPEFELQYDALDRLSPYLGFCVLHDSENRLQWNVRFDAPRHKTSIYLLFSAPIGDKFSLRTRCGCVELFRNECIISDEKLIMNAVCSFLQTGRPDPSLLWMKWSDCTRDP